MSHWLELARRIEEELAQQPPEVQQAIRQLSRRQYRQPPIAEPELAKKVAIAPRRPKLGAIAVTPLNNQIQKELIQ